MECCYFGLLFPLFYFRKNKCKDKASNVLIIYILENIRAHFYSKKFRWKVYAKGLMLLASFPERTNVSTSFASDCCFVKFLLQFHTLRVKFSKHPYHGRLIFKGIWPLLMHQRKQVGFQRCSMYCVLSETDTQYTADLTARCKLIDLQLFWFLCEPFQGREKPKG